MNDTGTVGHCNIAVAGYEMRLLMLLCRCLSGTGEQRLILLVFQILSLIALEDLIGGFILRCELAQHLVEQRLRHIIGITVGSLDLHIGFIRVHAERNVGRQCPRCRCPCKKIRILTDALESHDRGTLLYGLIALCDLLRGERGSAARAVGNDLEALVEQSLVPDGLQCPPLGLDEIVIIGDIRVIHVSPEANCAGEILPHSLIFPDAFLTFIDERLQTVGLDLILSVQSKQLLNLDLNRKAVCVPACLSRHHTALHGAVSRNHIFDNTGLHMSDMRLSVCSRRAVVKGISRALLPAVNALLEDVVLLPELFHSLFSLHKIECVVYLLVHFSLPFLIN